MNETSGIPKIAYVLARRVALIAIVFALILSILMIANYIQTKSIEPLNHPMLKKMVLDLQKDPKNQALKEQIRTLDLLARKAYFTNQWQIRTGGFLLFSALLIILVALKFLNAKKSRFPDLNNENKPDMSWEEKILARKSIVFSGLFIIIIALLAGIFSESEISHYPGSEQLATFPTAEELRQNWPGFRGPAGLGIAYQTDVPKDWNGQQGKNICWKIPVPKPGFNSPIIWEDKLFFSGADKESQEVYCIDTETGAINWTMQLNDIPGSPAKKPKVTKDTGFAASTMTTDGQRVFVIYATGDVACLDFEGKRVWVKNLGVPDNHYGHASSLLMYKNLLLVQYDHNESKNLFALNNSNGALVYNTVREDQISWASPILIDTGKRSEVILSSNPHVISYNPADGKELWRVDCMYGEVAPSPAFSDNMVFAVNEFAILAGIKLGEQVSLAWEYDEELSEVSSPVAVSGLLFVATSFGTVSCFNAENGEIYWSHEFDKGFYSSPVIAAGHVYLMDMSGVTHIFKAKKEFELINEPELGEDAMTVPAFMPGKIYIRGVENLYCIGVDNG
jgi:outer membrane protein assembly factor BamB